MSMLNQLFNRGVLGAKCKTCLTLVISRIKLIQNKRDVNLKLMRKEIVQFLKTGQEAIARIRVEHVIREQNIQAAYDILALFCEFVLARVPVLESQKECPPELREAIASIVFAAPRCSDLPDLLQVRNLFGTKYGKEFVMAASELRPDTSVNRSLIEKLSVNAPSPEARLELLKQIALEYNMNWDSSKTEAEFQKNHEDLLSGTKKMLNPTTPAEVPIQQVPVQPKPSNGVHEGSPSNSSQGTPHTQSLILPRNGSLSKPNEIQPTVRHLPAQPISETRSEPKPRPSEVLEMAQQAIASAERACVAARAAAALVNSKYISHNNSIQAAK
ncbi:unnamed protein product [Rhodiola kirilowii]